MLLFLTKDRPRNAKNVWRHIAYYSFMILASFCWAPLQHVLDELDWLAICPAGQHGAWKQVLNPWTPWNSLRSSWILARLMHANAWKKMRSKPTTKPGQSTDKSRFSLRREGRMLAQNNSLRWPQNISWTLFSDKHVSIYIYIMYLYIRWRNPWWEHYAAVLALTKTWGPVSLESSHAFFSAKTLEAR